MNIKNLLKLHQEQLDSLIKHCSHKPKDIKIYEDKSVVGRGSAYPSVHVVCKNCRAKKIIFRRTSTDCPKEILPILTKQGGFEDERLDLRFRYDWEIED